MTPADDPPSRLPYARLPAGARVTVVAMPDILIITFTRPSIARYLARALFIYVISVIGLLAALVLFAAAVVCIRQHVWLSTLVARLIRNWRRLADFPWDSVIGVIPSTTTIFALFTLLAWPRTLVVELTRDVVRSRVLFDTRTHRRSDVRNISADEVRVVLHLDDYTATLCHTRHPAETRWLADLLRYELSKSPTPGGTPLPLPASLPEDIRKPHDGYSKPPFPLHASASDVSCIRKGRPLPDPLPDRRKRNRHR